MNLDIPSHGFINGERVYYECTSGQSGITDGNYFVKFIDTNTIKLRLIVDLL